MVRTMGTIRPYKVVTDRYESQSSYTIDIDLPDKGRFSYMDLLVKVRSDTDGKGGGPFVKTLCTSVSISEGGQSHLCSAPVEAFQADYWYKTGRTWREGRHKWQSELGECISQIPILFGESIVDPNYGIDLAKMSDPQLSITYNMANTGVDGETPFGSSYYPRFTPIIYLQEGTWPALQGYQSLRQIDKYIPANSEEHKTELKGGRPIKRIYAHLDIVVPYYEWGHTLATGKLWGDNEKYKPFEFTCFEWQQVIRDCFGLFTFPWETYYHQSSQGMDCVAGSPISIEGHGWIAEHFTDPALSSGRHMAPKFYRGSDGLVANEIAPISLYATGYTPWDVMVIDAEKMLGMEWLDPSNKAPMYLELDHKSGAAAIGGPVKVHILDKAVQL